MAGLPEFPRADDQTLMDGMKEAARLNLPVAVHAESEEITRGLAKAIGGTGAREFLASRPVVAETEAVERVLAMAKETGAKLHIVHMSSGEAVTLAVAERRGGQSKGLFTTSPVVIVEVLSPSTADLDQNVKPAEYMSFASLTAYIIASQDRPDCTVWLRGPDGRFPDAPVVIAGMAAVVEIDQLGIVIPLAGVYQGLETA